MATMPSVNTGPAGAMPDAKAAFVVAFGFGEALGCNAFLCAAVVDPAHEAASLRVCTRINPLLRLGLCHEPA